MDTTDMPDETVLPGHMCSLGEMRDTIKCMRKLNDDFYWMVFHAGLGGRCHAFVEFCGLQSKFIDMCEGALKNGIEFPMANQHARAEWPLDTHHAEYLGEKFECIYGFAIGPNPVLREAFLKSFVPKQRERCLNCGGSGYGEAVNCPITGAPEPGPCDACDGRGTPRDWSDGP